VKEKIPPEQDIYDDNNAIAGKKGNTQYFGTT
jgi:hypothetical protein